MVVFFRFCWKFTGKSKISKKVRFVFWIMDYCDFYSDFVVCCWWLGRRKRAGWTKIERSIGKFDDVYTKCNWLYYQPTVCCGQLGPIIVHLNSNNKITLVELFFDSFVLQPCRNILVWRRHWWLTVTSFTDNLNIWLDH